MKSIFKFDIASVLWSAGADFLWFYSCGFALFHFIFYPSSHSPLSWKERERWKFVRSAGPQIEFQRPRNRLYAGGWKYFRSPARRSECRGHMEIEIFPDMCFYLAPRPAIVFMDYLIKFANDRSLHPDGRRASLFSAFRLRLRPKIINTTLRLLRVFTARGRKFYLGALS